MFSVELKPVPNNKDIFNVDSIQHWKIKFEPPNRYFSMCKLSKIRTHQKLLPPETEMRHMRR
jgi:hypothetical protein